MQMCNCAIVQPQGAVQLSPWFSLLPVWKDDFLCKDVLCADLKEVFHTHTHARCTRRECGKTRLKTHTGGEDVRQESDEILVRCGLASADHELADKGGVTEDGRGLPGEPDGASEAVPEEEQVGQAGEQGVRQQDGGGGGEQKQPG